MAILQTRVLNRDRWLGDLFLDRTSAVHGIGGLREGEHRTVANGLDDRAVVGSDSGTDPSIVRGHEFLR